MFIMYFLSCSEGTHSEPLLSGSLDVLSYNIHGLPSAVTGDDTQARITQLAPKMNSFDVIGIQEDWMEEFYPILLEGADLPYSDRFDVPYDDEKVYGAGLSFLGRYPIIGSTHIYYESCFGFLDNASDCFASKGLQFLELHVDGMVLHFYNTHLEAGNGVEDHEVRAEQIEMILTQINMYSHDHPVILMGDFNLEPNDEADSSLLSKLRVESGLELTCTLVDCPEPNHIDQIYIRSSANVSLEAVSWDRVEDFVDDVGVPLSDHPAITTQILWSKTGED